MGLVAFSVLADKFGRKVIIVATIVVTTLGIISNIDVKIVFSLGSFWKELVMMFVGIILMGFGCYSLSNVCYSFLSEVTS